MTDGLAAKVVLAARPKGKPIDTDFRIEKFPIPQSGTKELLLQTRYLSIDPYMRGRMDDKKSYAPPYFLRIHYFIKWLLKQLENREK